MAKKSTLDDVQTSATTESTTGNTMNYDDHVRHMGCVDEIWDSSFDYEMNMIGFDLSLYNGDLIHVNFKREHIHEMMLFLKKEQANKRYVEFIMNK